MLFQRTSTDTTPVVPDFATNGGPSNEGFAYANQRPGTPEHDAICPVCRKDGAK